ncbi:caspase-8 [Periplaneta americana]|uniref:caspase-8 n=1 Tax=Periplaneta americana TaxID=6978 RepID=UPI0037E93BFE
MDDTTLEMVEEEDIPSIFGELLDEERSLRSSSSSLANDAFGLMDTTISGYPFVTFLHQNLTKEAVITELQGLEYYEKVSLAFLLYDDVDYVLQNLRISERARLAGSLIPVDFLTPWITLQRDGTWENKLLEAFCIIQNYEILHKLGCNIRDVKMRFLPYSPESSLFVNCTRKCLYHVCESLDATSLETLAKHVKEDYSYSHNAEELEIFDPEYMEINILNWSSRGYISLGDKEGRGVDIHRLKTQLKAMGEFNLVEKLESSVRATVNASVGYTSEMNTPDDMSLQGSSVGSLTDSRSEQSSISQHSVASTCDQLTPPVNSVYHVNPRSVGYCVIINQKNFFKDPRQCLQNLLPDHTLETRLGTDVDRDRLSETFCSLGFNVWMVGNLTDTQLRDCVYTALKELVKPEHSCFVLCILSHGVEGAVYGINSIPVYVDELKNLMENCSNLLGKPKILIIQACQGQDHQDAVDVATDGPVYSKSRSSDCVTFWSTVPGFASFRHEIDGTWFIQSICEHLLSSHPSDDLYRLFTYVNNQVSAKRARVSGEFKTMVPYFTSTLTKLLYLPLHPGAKVKMAHRMFERHLTNALIREYILSRRKMQLAICKLRKNRSE